MGRKRVREGPRGWGGGGALYSLERKQVVARVRVVRRYMTGLDLVSQVIRLPELRDLKAHQFFSPQLSTENWTALAIWPHQSSSRLSL